MYHEYVNIESIMAIILLTHEYVTKQLLSIYTSLQFPIKVLCDAENYSPITLVALHIPQYTGHSFDNVAGSD